MIEDFQLNDPRTLYRRWESSQWSPFDVELSVGQALWPTIPGEQRELMLFAMSSLMVAEERITTKFSGLVGAGGAEEVTVLIGVPLDTIYA